MNYWIATKAQSSNWFDNDIAGPQALGAAMVLAEPCFLRVKSLRGKRCWPRPRSPSQVSRGKTSSTSRSPASTARSSRQHVRHDQRVQLHERHGLCQQFRHGRHPGGPHLSHPQHPALHGRLRHVVHQRHAQLGAPFRRHVVRPHRRAGTHAGRLPARRDPVVHSRPDA